MVRVKDSPPRPLIASSPHHLSHGFLFVLVFDEYISPSCYFVLVFDESTLRFDFHCVSISPSHRLTSSPFTPPHHSPPLNFSPSHLLTLSSSFFYNLSCYLANCHLPLRDSTSHPLTTHTTSPFSPLTPNQQFKQQPKISFTKQIKRRFTTT